MPLEDLGNYDVVRMDEEEIRAFLSSQSVGVLGLSTDGPPSMRPMSFWFDGESSLYFLYVVGSSSRKERISRTVDVARFLVYRAETTYNWRSVLLTGTISQVPDGERESIQSTMEMAGRPAVIDRASESERTAIYRFDTDELVGIKHLALPPEFETDAPGRNTE